MYSRIYSSVCLGMEGRTVFVETDIARGLPGINIVGLPSTMVMESRERIKSAILNSGYEFPHGRITVNLTPASLRKNGSCLDLPIAIAILCSSGELDTKTLRRWGIIGELALDGRVLGVDGALPMMIRMKDEGLRGIVIPDANRSEASMIEGNINIIGSLRECVDLLRELPEGPGYHEAVELSDDIDVVGDFGEISGQENAKRAMVIAAAGRHGLLMIGTPGCGKTMLAGRMPAIMPPMNEREILETAIIRSVSGHKGEEVMLSRVRPFRSPHHSIGRAGLIGGGSNIPVPGEITLAHNGVLFLDEICEFDRGIIESLRIPLEEKSITHFRNGEAYKFPCNFQIVMAANPCPCGFLGDPDRECKCTQAELDRYRRKLSGPIMDRIDMSISMEKVSYDDLTADCKGMDSKTMQAQVEAAIGFADRCGRKGFNSELSTAEMDEYCRLGPAEAGFMSSAYRAFRMSPRSYNRTLKVARTIADLDASKTIRTEHLAEALNYRMEYEE